VDRPQKKDGLEMHEVNGQFVIYETSRDAVHYLNPTAALVLEFCDGNHSSTEIAALVQEAYGMPSAPFDDISGCLGHLHEIGLVD
jgi:hypothetical protein